MITYRIASPADAQALARMRCTFLMEAADLSSEAQLSEMEPVLLAYFTAALADGSFVAWLALDDDAIIATSGLSFSLVPPSYGNKSGKIAYIMNMYTCPNIAGEVLPQHCSNTQSKKPKHAATAKLPCMPLTWAVRCMKHSAFRISRNIWNCSHDPQPSPSTSHLV